MDRLEEQLWASHVDVHSDPAVGSALSELAAARAMAGQKTRRRRTVALSVVAGAVLAVGGGGAVAAVQWGPWSITNPDLVVSRDWTDVNGAYLGACQSRIATNDLPPDAVAAARDYLASLNVGSLKPNPERVAGGLRAVGRLDEVGRLVEGAQPSDFDIHHQGPLWDAAWFTDARIMQDALMDTVYTGLSKELLARYPELEKDGITANGQTQCSTDPTTTGTR